MVEELIEITRELDQIKYDDDYALEWFYVDKLYSDIDDCIIQLRQMRDEICSQK